MKTDYENKSMPPPAIVVLHASASGEERQEFDNMPVVQIRAYCAARWGPGRLVHTKLRGDKYMRWESLRC